MASSSVPIVKRKVIELLEGKMRIFEALLSELKRLESVSNEHWNQEMQTNEELGILVFAAKEAIEEIAWGSIQVTVYWKDVEDKDRVNAIIEKVLGQ